MKNVIILIDKVDSAMQERIQKILDHCSQFPEMLSMKIETKGDVPGATRRANKVMDGSINFVVVLVGENLKEYSRTINSWADKVNADELIAGCIAAANIDNHLSKKCSDNAEVMFLGSVIAMIQKPLEEKFPRSLDVAM